MGGPTRGIFTAADKWIFSQWIIHSWTRRAPKFSQRSIGTINRVHFWQCYSFNVPVGLWTFTRFAVIHVPVLSTGVSADHPKITTRTQIFVGHSSRDNDYI